MRAIRRRRCVSNPRFYSLAVWMVMLAQVQLIFIAELHRHGYPLLLQTQKAPICTKQSKSNPAPTEDAPCIVCQIVRQSAVRPATICRPLQASRRIILHPVAILEPVRDLTASILPVRSPPVPE
ncbi:MAG: hypothetical protein ACRD3O_05015 [Terriglobia bacterium]